MAVVEKRTIRFCDSRVKMFRFVLYEIDWLGREWSLEHSPGSYFEHFSAHMLLLSFRELTNWFWNFGRVIKFFRRGENYFTLFPDSRFLIVHGRYATAMLTTAHWGVLFGLKYFRQRWPLRFLPKACFASSWKGLEERVRKRNMQRNIPSEHSITHWASEAKRAINIGCEPCLLTFARAGNVPFPNQK